MYLSNRPRLERSDQRGREFSEITDKGAYLNNRPPTMNFDKIVEASPQIRGFRVM
jgi:hypothetical protein